MSSMCPPCNPLTVFVFPPPTPSRSTQHTHTVFGLIPPSNLALVVASAAARQPHPTRPRCNTDWFGPACHCLLAWQHVAGRETQQWLVRMFKSAMDIIAYIVVQPASCWGCRNSPTAHWCFLT